MPCSRHAACHAANLQHAIVGQVNDPKPARTNTLHAMQPTCSMPSLRWSSQLSEASQDQHAACHAADMQHAIVALVKSIIRSQPGPPAVHAHQLLSAGIPKGPHRLAGRRGRSLGLVSVGLAPS